MTDESTKSARDEAAGTRRTTPASDVLPELAVVERIMTRDFREAVAIDDLTQELVGRLLRLVDTGVSITELGAPEQVVDVMIHSIHPSPPLNDL